MAARWADAPPPRFHRLGRRLPPRLAAATDNRPAVAAAADRDGLSRCRRLLSVVRLRALARLWLPSANGRREPWAVLAAALCPNLAAAYPGAAGARRAGWLGDGHRRPHPRT